MSDHWSDRLQQLGAAAKGLDPAPREMAAWWRQLGEYGTAFLKGIGEAPAFHGRHQVDSGKPTPADDPQPLESVLVDFDRTVRGNGINPASGRFFGYIPGGGVPSAAVGDFVAALVNPYSGAAAASPGAVDIENQVVGWLRDLLDFPAESWGTLQSGGSLSTLTAIVAARAGRPFEEWPKSVVYATAETHHCFAKALQVAGLAVAPLRTIAVDSQFRLSVPDLEKQVAADKEAGLKPWLVCASAGTTNTGAVDPLEELAAVCRRERLWFHVDAAYGGFFYLAESARALLSGMRKADSLVLDPHKGLFQPYGIGAVLVRDARGLKSSLSYQPDYMRDVADEASRSPMDYSPELTRHFRAARLWFSLKLNGLVRFRAALEEKLLLARYAYDELKGVSGILVGPVPQLSVVTFRAHGEGAKADEATSRLLTTILRRGVVHLSSTRLHGQVYLRLCVLCFRSHLADIDRALDEIKNDL